MRTINLLGITLLVTFSVFSCKKDSGGSTTLRVKLTDAPASFEEVNVDLKEIRIKLEGDTSSWLSMKTEAGIYNLLELQNGVDTLISELVLPQGKVKEIRLVLGQENSIKAGGEVFPLTIPSGSESGLKIKVDKELRGPVDSLLIDFDAALSVKSEEGGYKLRPVVKLVY